MNSERGHSLTTYGRARCANVRYLKVAVGCTITGSMPQGQPLPPLRISDTERASLERLARQRTVSRKLSTRAHIVLEYGRGRTTCEVAALLGVDVTTARKWRESFRVRRVVGLSDEPRAGTPRRLSDDIIIEVLRRTISTRPQNATHWNASAMAAATCLSPSSIVRIWRAVGLEPDRSGSFSRTGDPLQIDNACDIAGLYLSAAGNAIVVCIDKRSHVGPLDLSRPPVFPLRAAVPERRIHDNTSGGLISLLFELRTASAKILRPREVQQQHALLAVLDKIDSDVSSCLEAHTILDDYAPYTLPAVLRWFAQHPRFRLHATPTRASWSNQVTRFLAGMTRRRIEQAAFPALPT